MSTIAGRQIPERPRPTSDGWRQEPLSPEQFVQEMRGRIVEMIGGTVTEEAVVAFVRREQQRLKNEMLLDAALTVKSATVLLPALAPNVAAAAKAQVLPAVRLQMCRALEAEVETVESEQPGGNVRRWDGLTESAAWRQRK